MKSLGVIVLLVLSVTALLHIPPAIADQATIRMEPAKIVTGQTTVLYFADPNATNSQAEVTYYYGGIEIDQWSVLVNRTYQQTISLPDLSPSTCQGHRCYGFYTLRLWIHNTTYWADFEYVWSYSEIADDQNRNSLAVMQSNGDLGRLIVSAEYGAISIFLLLMIIIIFWGQHKSAVRRSKRSWARSIQLRLLQAVRMSPESFNKPSPKVTRLLDAMEQFFGALDGPASGWDGAEIAVKNKMMIQVIKETMHEARNTPTAKARRREA